ncbi:MAG: response regulator [Candidatus Gracilibacteria bacterium]|nr:response regulator [Candidatus Gracilibacteria bacterium]MDD2908368.1 response regulator [Candidatus Gracilibacteria bacterium]
MDNIKVLIVEDDLDLATMYKLKFEKEGFETRIADNGFIAVTQVTEFQPNIILLDIMMPSMDGFETLRVIRQLAPSLKCKIIMFSNLNSKSDIDRSLSSGADAYLLKANTTPKQAVEKIYELLGEKTGELTKEVHGIQKNNHSCPHCGGSLDVKIEIVSK